MQAMLIRTPAPIEQNPLEAVEVPKPVPAKGQVCICIKACGVCHTDLHVVEGELALKTLPIIPGHQIVGVVESVGEGVRRFAIGDRVGVPWLYSTCGDCEFCRAGKENLCDSALFTGYTANGGYAQYITVLEDFAYPLPAGFSDLAAAPLLCAGVIGFRALRLSDVRPRQRLGLYGFGASAHVVIQIAIHWGCEVYVFSRSEAHRQLAQQLGAAWTGRAEDEPPDKLNSAIIFAPVGELVLKALRVLKKGGTVVHAGVHSSPIPQMDYDLLYHERTVRSVANSTRQDVEELLRLAAEIPIRTEVQTFPLAQANKALQLLKEGRINGAAVLKVPDVDTQ